jgi:hypothetical protein
MFLESTRTSTLVELPRDSSTLPSFDPSKPPPFLMANPVPDYAVAYSDPSVPSLDGTGSLAVPDVAALYTPYHRPPQQHVPQNGGPRPAASLLVPPVMSQPLAPASSLSALSPVAPVGGVASLNHVARYEHVGSMRSSAERSPTFADSRAAGLYSGAAVAAPEIHTAVAVDAAEEERRAASRERDQQKPLTAKEKRRLEMGQKEVWQYVGRKIFTDKIFLRRRKKKGSSSPEEDKEELKVSFSFFSSLFLAQCCGSGMFNPFPGAEFFPSGIQKIVSKLLEI